MRRIKKMNLEELVMENKRQLMNDREAMDRIDDRLDARRLTRAE